MYEFYHRARRAGANLLRRKHESRRYHYRQVFCGDDGAPTPSATQVLADLRRFCKATDSSHVPGDPYSTAVNEGRREVWNWIQGYLNLSDEQIARLVEDFYPEQAEGFE